MMFSSMLPFAGRDRGVGPEVTIFLVNFSPQVSYRSVHVSKTRCPLFWFPIVITLLTVGFILLKCIDFKKADLRALVLPSKNFPLVLKLLISKKYNNNKGSKRKECDQSEKDMDLRECVQEHVRIQELFGKSGDFHERKGMKAKDRDGGWVGGFPYLQAESDLKTSQGWFLQLSNRA